MTSANRSGAVQAEFVDVMQHKTQRPVQFEITASFRDALQAVPAMSEHPQMPALRMQMQHLPLTVFTVRCMAARAESHSRPTTAASARTLLTFLMIGFYVARNGTQRSSCLCTA